SDGRRQNRLIAGVLLAALLTGIFRLCGTAAATVIAAALAVARTAFGTVLSGVRIVVGLLLGLVDQQLLVLRCGLLPAGLSALFLAAFLRSEEHTSELQSRENLVCRLLLEKKKPHNRRYNDLPVY